jgi:cytochrome c5
MDFDEWEKMKEYEEGRGAYQSLYDAVQQSVSKRYEGIDNYVCDSCHEISMSGNGQCHKCGSWNTRKI